MGFDMCIKAHKEENYLRSFYTCRNEIGGDGDVPHPAIGDARRLQVQDRLQQHKELVEAVQNHNPRVIFLSLLSQRISLAVSQNGWLLPLNASEGSGPTQPQT